MAIRDEFENSGLWLFRWRSFIPLLIIPLGLLALKDYGAMEKRVGYRWDNAWEAFCIVISFIGLLVRCYIVATTPKGTSGRNTKAQRADVLNTTGIYSLVRHPLYIGNFLIFLGVILFVKSYWFALVGVMAYVLYYERIIFGEESFLRGKFKEEFEKWAANTPVVFPKFSNWKKPDLPFSLKSILRREYNGLLGTIACFTGIKLVGHYFASGNLQIWIGWWIFLAAGTAIFLILWFLKKFTPVLKV